MLTSLFSRVFAAISMSMMLLIIAYSVYTAGAFEKLSNQTASELEQLTINSLEKQLSRQVADSARIVDTSYEGLLLNVNLTFKILSFLLPDADIAVSSQKTETASKSLPTLLLGGKVEWLHYLVQGLVKIIRVMRGVKWHKESMIRS